MAVNQRYPTLDGIVPSYADIAVAIRGQSTPLIEMVAIKSINTGITVEVGEQRGASGGRVLARTTGSSKVEASAELYYNGYKQMLRGLMAEAPTRGNEVLVSLVHFDIQVTFSLPNSAELYEFVVQGCRLLGRDINPAEGPDAVSVPIKLNPVKIADIVDGKEVVYL